MSPGSSKEERLAQVIWEQTRRQGLVHLYTGDGKGKTTAALGLALRALGYDRKVAVIQFLKRTTLKTGEMVFAEKIGAALIIRRFGASRFATEKSSMRSRKAARRSSAAGAWRANSPGRENTTWSCSTRSRTSSKTGTSRWPI